MSVTKWASLVAGGGGIPCEDLVSFEARCKSTGGVGHKLQARLTITVDGNPTPVTINGNQAQLQATLPGKIAVHASFSMSKGK